MRGPVFYRFGPFELDAASGQTFRQGTRIALPDSQRDILKYMVARAGEAVSKDVLMEAAWGGTNVEPNSLNRAISRLRKTLGGGREDAYIETVTGYGYRFVARVERSERDSTRADLAAELSPFRAFAEARTEIYSLDRTAIQRARDAAEAALRRAPDFAQAHARFALACALSFEASVVDAQPDTAILEVGVQHAREACEKVLTEPRENGAQYVRLLLLVCPTDYIERRASASACAGEHAVSLAESLRRNLYPTYASGSSEPLVVNMGTAVLCPSRSMMPLTV